MSAPTVPRGVWASSLVLLLTLGFGFSLFAQPQTLAQTSSSHGAAPYGWGAAYDVLAGLGLSPVRTRERLEAREMKRAQWLVQPSWGRQELPQRVAELRGFLNRGGTVVLISDSPQLWQELGFSYATIEHSEEQTAAQDAEPKEEVSGDNEQDNSPGGSFAELLRARPAPLRVAKGKLTRGRRRLRVPDTHLFDAQTGEAEGRQVLTTIHGAPFIVEQRSGEGRLVAVSDASWIRNDQLGDGHHANLLVDIVRAYGAASFDEYCHGLVKSASPWAALGLPWTSLALLVALLLATTLLMHQRRWHPSQKPLRATPPTLEALTQSLASLYEQRGADDTEEIFQVYRVSVLRRIRRLRYGAADVSLALVEKRLRADVVDGPAGRWLRGERQPQGRGELHAAVRSLERYADGLAPRGRPSAVTPTRGDEGRTPK